MDLHIICLFIRLFLQRQLDARLQYIYNFCYHLLSFSNIDKVSLTHRDTGVQRLYQASKQISIIFITMTLFVQGGVD